MKKPPANPVLAELSNDQLDMLRMVHKKYSNFAASKLIHDLTPGDQTIDLKLK